MYMSLLWIKRKSIRGKKNEKSNKKKEKNPKRNFVTIKKPNSNFNSHYRINKTIQKKQKKKKMILKLGPYSKYYIIIKLREKPHLKKRFLQSRIFDTDILIFTIFFFFEFSR